MHAYPTLLSFFCSQKPQKNYTSVLLAVRASVLVVQMASGAVAAAAAEGHVLIA